MDLCNLYCKGEPYLFNGLQDPLKYRQTKTQSYRYCYAKMKINLFMVKLKHKRRKLFQLNTMLMSKEQKNILLLPLREKTMLVNLMSNTFPP